jgi:integrase
MAKARRGRGEGSLFFSKTERLWIARVVVDGKRYVCKASTKEAAKLKGIDLQAKAKAGLLGEKAEQTNAETVEKVLRDYVAWGTAKAIQKISDSTAHRYEGIISSAAAEFGSLPASHLKRSHVEAYLAKQGSKPATVLKIYNLLRAALGRAVEKGILTENVCGKSLRPSVDREEVQPFTQDEITQLLDYARTANHRDLRLLVVARWTGLRSGELLGLQWEDVDFKAGLLRVNHNLANFAGAAHRKLGSPKSGKTRTVPLSSEAIEALKEQREYLMSQGHPRPWVFPNNDGKPMNGKHLLRRLKGLYKDAEVPVLDVHALRHTFASLALQSGVDYKSLQKILGHHSVALTIDVYGHLLPDALRLGIKKMEEHLARSAS